MTGQGFDDTGRLATRAGLGAVRRVSLALVALVVTASAAGIAFGANGLYAAYSVAVAGLVGQDLVSLGLAVPVLLLSMRSARRGSVPALLCWAGTLFYIAYSYAFLIIGGFNALFPVYVAIVAFSLHGLLALLLALDPPAIRRAFDGAVPRRRIGGFLAGVAVLFLLMWGGLSLGLIAAGEQPDPVVHLVVVLDGTVLLPALLVGGTKLWSGADWGYALGGVLLAKVALTGLTLGFTTALAATSVGAIAPFDAFLLVLFGSMGLASAGLLRVYARHAGPPGMPGRAAPTAPGVAGVAGT